MLANIEGVVPIQPTEEECASEREAERKIEAKQQSMEDIVMAEGGAVADSKPKAHIQSKSKTKSKEEEKKARELRKKHAEKMKQIRSQNRKAINPAFFSNAKGAVDENKGWAFDFEKVGISEPGKPGTVEKQKSEAKAVEEEKSKFEAEEEVLLSLVSHPRIEEGNHQRERNYRTRTPQPGKVPARRRVRVRAVRYPGPFRKRLRRPLLRLHQGSALRLVAFLQRYHGPTHQNQRDPARLRRT